MVDACEAVDFYAAAFGATVMHLVGEGDDVAQLGVGEAAFWIAPASSTMKRFDPRAKETSPVGDEHGWRLGRIVDPFGHEWEIGKPLGPRPGPEPEPMRRRLRPARAP